MSSSGTASASNNVKTMDGLSERIFYTWTVNDITCIVNPNGKIVYSPLFYNKNRDYSWRLGASINDLANTKYLGLYLSLDSLPNDEAEVKYTLTVRRSGEGVIKTERIVSRRFTKDECLRGIKQFLPWSEPSFRKKILKIDVEIVVKLHDLDPKAHIFVLGSDFPEAKFQKSMNELFESSKFTDVVFEVEEAKLKAHKLILSARSPVFAAMFTHESVEKRSGVVKIVDCSSKVFRLFLRFVYSGKVDISSFDVAAELYRIAEKYDFPDLKLCCTNFMSVNLNLSNVRASLLLAEAFSIKDLKIIAMDYIAENIKIFKDVRMEVYEPILENNPQLLTELLLLVNEKLLSKSIYGFVGESWKT